MQRIYYAVFARVKIFAALKHNGGEVQKFIS
jgi:hypothetical protein